MNNSNSGFYHHFIPKNLPCIFLPSVSPVSDSDHILNLSASLSKHCPIPKCPKEGLKVTNILPKNDTFAVDKCRKVSCSNDMSVSQNSDSDSDTYAIKQSAKRVDMNCNDLTKARNDEIRDNEDMFSNSSVLSERDRFDDEQTEIEVGDENFDEKVDNESKQSNIRRPNCTEIKKAKPLTFGIDRILSSNSEDRKDEKLPLSPSPSPISSNDSPPVVSSVSTKTDHSAEASKLFRDDKHQPLLSKLKLSTNESPKRSTTLTYFHHPYSPYQHHQHHSILQTTTTCPTGSTVSSGGAQNHHSLNHCSECLFLRRYCGGSSSGHRAGISSSLSSANNVVANNMQFSSPMATPCGPTSSSISASFTWMANPSIYDSSAIISPVAGYNPHVPLQPSFGIGTSFSTLATIQQCGSGGSSGRRKRSWSRAVFSNLQRKGLEKRFQIQKYITKPDRRQLAATLGLTDAQVKVWFQNRRMKWRHSKEGKVSSGTGESSVLTPASSPVTSTTSSKVDGATKDKKP